MKEITETNQDDTSENTRPLSKLAYADEVPGASDAQQLNTGGWEAAGSTAEGSPEGETSGSERVNVHEVLEDVSTGATPHFAAEVEFRKRSIGFVRRGYSTSGGAEAYLKRLAEGLLERGYRVVLLGTGEWPAEAWPGDEVVVLSNRSLRSFAKEVLEYKKKEALDLLFSLERVPGCDIFRAGDGVHAAWLQRRNKRESRWSKWLSSWMSRHREVLTLERELFSPESVTHVIANSTMVAQEIREHFQFPETQLKIIPNGVPSSPSFTTEERHAARELFGIKEGELAVLFVGSGWKRKGVGVAIQAVEKSLSFQQEPDSRIRLWVAGKGSTRNYQSKAVHFLGPVKKMELLYGAADLFILPTLYDPFANASLEALAAGLPVITTAANGCAEIIEEGVHGSVIQDPNDVDGFTDAILFWRERLQSQQEKTIRDACRQRAAAFDMEKNLERTIEVMEQVLAKNSPQEGSL